jgi:Spy/CpxP family protein refolding chaperone
MLVRVILAIALLLPSSAFARLSPYAGQQVRAIKAFSDADIEGLLQGRGMELAKPAELNGYPGPSHSLDLAQDLGLTPEQITALKQIQQRMAADAKALGAKIIEKERALDRLFTDRSISAQKLQSLNLEIGELRGRLRTVHLVAHIETVDILTPEQVKRYDVLRGYTEPSAATHEAQPASAGREHGKH